MEEILRGLAARAIAPEATPRLSGITAKAMLLVLGGVLAVASIVFLVLGLFWALGGVYSPAAAAAITGAAALLLLAGGLVILAILEQRRRIAEARAREARADADLSALGYEMGRMLGRKARGSTIPVLALMAAIGGALLWNRPPVQGRRSAREDPEADMAGFDPSGTEASPGSRGHPRGNGAAENF